MKIIRNISMMLMKYYLLKKKKRLFQNIVRGIIPKERDSLEKIKYGDLEKYIDSINADEAIRAMRNLFHWNCECLKNEKVIKIAFLVYSSSEWSCETLYRMFERDERFEPIIVLCGYGHGTEETIRETYINTCEYFRNAKQKYHIEYAGYCNRNYINCVFDKFHILVYIEPYSNGRPNEINCSFRNITQLFVHIPYGYTFIDLEKWFLESSVIKLCWIYFCENNAKRNCFKNSRRLGDYNIRVSGYPKLDEIIENNFFRRNYLWKYENTCELKIIWAPHFNLMKGMNGTFHENYRWFYEFAREHQEISWIVRPHPRMEWGAVEYGVFKSGQEYKKYLENWNALPNAQVISDGGYYDIFNSSDAMILDSLTFIVEYQFTGKPLLFLQSESPRPLNEFGRLLDTILYKCRGNEFAEIEKFLRNVQKGEDPMRKTRENFRRTYLETSNDTNKMPTQYIYDEILKEIFG